MREELKYIFSNVNDWLRFAEAKHAGLIVLNSAIIVGILSVFSNPIIEKWSAIVTIAFLGLSICSSLFAQFPVTTNLLLDSKGKERPNIYFFGDLGAIDSDQFVEEFKKSFPEFKSTPSDENLINQILVNAKITSSKYMVFKFCCYLSIIGIGIICISSLIQLGWG